MKKRICKICKKVSSLKNFYFMQKWRSWTCKKCVIMAVIKRQNTVGSNAWWNRRYERLKSRAKRSHKKFNLSFIDFRILKKIVYQRVNFAIFLKALPFHIKKC